MRYFPSETLFSCRITFTIPFPTSGSREEDSPAPPQKHRGGAYSHGAACPLSQGLAGGSLGETGKERHPDHSNQPLQDRESRQIRDGLRGSCHREGPEGISGLALRRRWPIRSQRTQILHPFSCFATVAFLARNSSLPLPTAQQPEKTFSRNGRKGNSQGYPKIPLWMVLGIKNLW